MEITKNSIKRLTDKQKKIIDYLEKLDVQNEDLKIENIAKHANVGFSTIYNLINKLGFKNFKDFHKAALLETMQVPERNISNWEGIFGYYKDTIKLTERIADPIKIKLLVNNILNYKNIYIIGHGSSKHVAKDFSDRLFRFGIRVIVMSEDSITQRMQINLIQEKSLIIAISVSGNTPEIVHLLQIGKETKAYITLITSNDKSNCAIYSDSIIHCANTSYSEKYEYSISPMISTLIILDLITQFLVEKNKEFIHNRHKTNKVLNKY